MAQVIGEQRRFIEPMQGLEDAETCARVGANVHKPVFRAGHGTLAGLGHLLRQGHFARGQEHDAP